MNLYEMKDGIVGWVQAGEPVSRPEARVNAAAK
jgi:hypothetical protein